MLSCRFLIANFHSRTFAHCAPPFYHLDGGREGEEDLETKPFKKYLLVVMSVQETYTLVS